MPPTSPAVRGRFLENSRRGRGRPTFKENMEQHNREKYDWYNRENALGRRQLRRRKRPEVAEEALATGRQRSPRWVAGGAFRPLITNTHGDSDAYHR